jgi:O-antigen/teichoic acid export membrane protein
MVRSKFARDAFVLQLATLVQGATYFITSVLTKRYLGLDDMGRWVAAREMFTLAYFFVSMGVVNATLSRYSEAIGRQDRAGAVNALAAMIKIGSLSAAAVLLLGFTLAPWAGERFYEDRLIGVYTQWLCIAGLFEVVRGLTVAALQGTRQMRAFAVFDIVTTVLRVGIVWAALAAGWGVPGVVGAFLVHMLAAGVMAVLAYQRAGRGDAKLAPPPLGEVLAAVPRAPVGHIFGIGYLLALNKSMNTLVPRFGMLLIPALGVATASRQAFADNAAYSIGHVLSWGLSLAMTGVAQTLLPALGFRLGRDDVPFEQMGGYLRRVSLASGLFMTVATVLSVPVMYVVIQVFYGADAADARAFEYYLWLVSGNLFIGFTVVVESFYIYSGRLRQVLPWNLLMASAGLAGIILGGRWF